MKFKDYMHQGFIYGDAEQRGMRVCAISPESSRMYGQACLNRRADIRRVTDSEQLMLRAARYSERHCRELCVSRNQISPEGGRADGQRTASP